MRIYARRSLFKDCDFNEMFNVTQAGMTFYHDLFGKKYPFNKYDQIFTPEHNFGAMENVGVSLTMKCIFSEERFHPLQRDSDSLTQIFMS